MKLPHRRPQLPIDTKEKFGISERVYFLLPPTKIRLILVFYNTIKENYNDHSVKTAGRNFCLKKYSANILAILIVVLLNIYFFLENYFLLAIL